MSQSPQQSQSIDTPGVGDSLLTRRHHLPHWQQGGSTYFITFRSARGQLPDEALRILRSIILASDDNLYQLSFGVLMPDHAHLMLRPLERVPGHWWDLARIMKRIKGVSARAVNASLGTRGRVWQQESFDRIVRDEAEFRKHWNYMYLNPLRAGLVDDPEEYEFLIRP